MARPLRIEFAGALYHVTSRGDGREAIFLDDDDRNRFLEGLAEVVRHCNWAIHAYCLMGNHYHLLVETPEGNLAKGMRQLNGVYTQRFNRRHGRVGHVFQGRYKAILVQKDAYLLELSRYIVLNPVRAGMARNPAEWPWSSYRATAGLCDAPVWLCTDGWLSVFSDQRRAAVAGYAAFVAAGIHQPGPWGSLKSQIFLGSDAFVTELQGDLRPDIPLNEIPTVQRRPPPPPLSQFAEAHDRDEAIQRAYASGGYSLKEIGDYFGLHYSRISRILQKQRMAKDKTRPL
ncbi:MAG: addiction module toxin RelE [Proteobacteria bacterium]|nr:addiction module toxin RelE [Pseudomonadota bacterium]